MVTTWQIDLEIIEDGDIFFFYKPKRSIDHPRGIHDISRFFFVLSPREDAPARYIVTGQKGLPAFKESGSTTWGFVQIVGGRGFATSKLAKSTPKGTSRPAGEGVYVILKHRDHTHLLYVLELPNNPGVVQKAFGIEREGNYIFLERSTHQSPSSPDVPFSNFSPASIANLNHRGTEILLIGVGADIGRVGMKAVKETEELNSADVFSKLKMDRGRHPTTSLISGDWT